MKAIIILTIILFAGSTLLTMQLHGSSDGINAFGFPLTFHDSFGGKCDDCYARFGFKPLNLIFDLWICISLAFLTKLVKRRIVKSRTEIDER
jgi:hypothetical protein